MNEINFNKNTNFGFKGILDKLNRYIPPNIDVNIVIYDGENERVFDYRLLPQYCKVNRELNPRFLRAQINISIFDEVSRDKITKFIYGTSKKSKLKDLYYDAQDLIDMMIENLTEIAANGRSLSALSFHNVLKSVESEEDILEYVDILDDAKGDLKDMLNMKYEDVRSTFMSFYLDLIRIRNQHKSLTENKYCNVVESNSEVDVYTTSLATTIFFKKGMKWSELSND